MTLAAITAAVLGLLGVVLGVSLVNLTSSVTAEERAMARQAELSQLARDLGGASDLLTDEARMYSASRPNRRTSGVLLSQRKSEFRRKFQNQSTRRLLEGLL